ncbi:hypothetical protein F442_13509 [Phytophthora nicotianae P10297]|uniref:Short-chain dehydrogenase/reductase SDR n=3 Tax=Phytophthora nicotianae TaxID=4792 RepID=W2R5G4_PHYN3|nr:hypothetical protein PPTG_21342 [Phytophthora nicotianae INRA-310]ETI41097.1 hypothetical protein F443_13649 [Phytophthora nicotianae P1569]ETN20642.1 hypothetical protein PPTG_21342 [Phytophthora nicotianae INRA-310]ETP38999.1 hypothetical protein F442_13509 [Phytophthora nicotianae P10297]
MPPHFSKRLQLGKFPVQPPTLYTLATISTITTILTTGSTRGIGLAFTKHYAKAGWNVIDTAPCHCYTTETTGFFKQSYLSSKVALNRITRSLASIYNLAAMVSLIGKLNHESTGKF